MPYIIDTKSPRATARTADGHALALYERRAARGEPDYDVVSSLAVATIEEARSTVLTEFGDRDAIDGPEHELCGHVLDLTETGGTAGPLPDGYVIDVRPVSWTEIATLAGYNTMTPRDDLAELSRVGYWGQGFADEIIDAYNSRGG